MCDRFLGKPLQINIFGTGIKLQIEELAPENTFTPKPCSFPLQSWFDKLVHVACTCLPVY